MNERINDLVDKTAVMISGVYTIEYESGKKGVEFNEEALNKFAELIVQDCISQIAMIGVSNYYDNDVSWTVDKSIENIRKHFGVQE